MIKKAYVVGSKTSDSLSPLIFNYWFKKLKIKAKYSYKEIKRKNFNKEIEKILKEENVCGLNITIPYKEVMFKKIKKTDQHSKNIGAINCLTKKKQ